MTPMIPEVQSSYDRGEEHESDAMRLLARLREIPQSAPDDSWPSTAELQREGIFGLRPVNRLIDLRRGKYGHKYDIEKINCGHGTFRWRLHEPNRPGYPKDKNQTVLPLPAPAPKKEIPWSERRPVTGLELWDAAVRQ